MRVGMVVFVDGQEEKNAYRLYTFPELEGSSDDYLALASFAARRMESGPPWPDLLLIDGGRGQLSAVERALREHGGQDIKLAALAKGETRRAGELGDVVFRPGRKSLAHQRRQSGASFSATRQGHGSSLCHLTPAPA